jgi:hypothetical protein
MTAILTRTAETNTRNSDFLEKLPASGCSTVFLPDLDAVIVNASSE